jgi:hypothetical protein
MMRIRARSESTPVRSWRPRWLVMLVVAAGIAALAAGMAVAHPSQHPIAKHKRSLGTKIAVVRTVSGRNLYVKRSANGQFVHVVKGTVLYLHDILAAGPRTKLTMRLVKRPRVSRKTIDLLDFYKQLAAATPRRSAVVREFFIAPHAATEFRTVDVVRSGGFIEITLHP